MTKIIFEKKNDEYCFELFGHAGYDDTGKDIVCSAVSMLVYTLSETLSNASNNNWVKINELVLNSGNVRISYTSLTPTIAYVITKTILNGFCLLANQYPENVTLNSNL